MATKDAPASLAVSLDDNFSDFNEILCQMKDDNKAKRRKALEKYNLKVFESDTDPKLDLSKLLQFTITSLVPRLSDQAEINRIHACNIILKFIESDSFSDKHLINIIPVLYNRLSTVPQLEESEDVRLLYINILQGFVQKFQNVLIPYMNDIVLILRESALDKCPEARKAASECISSFAKATKEKFHMQGESLVQPLIKGLSHQRFKNRIASLNALGDILLYGDNKVIKDVSGPLAQCSMDLPQVRLALVTVGGSLALNMLDRYSYWHYILPLFLFGLSDDDADVKNKATALWKDVGEQYEKENDQLKDEIEFDVGFTNFPFNENRPCVGCRMLVYKSLYYILPGLLTDLDDWQAGPRFQAAKLLTTLVLNAGTSITQYAEKIMVALHLAVDDKEEHIVKQVVLCTEYLGHFLPPVTYLPLVLPRLSSGEKSERPLKVLAALLRGSPSNLLAVEIGKISQAISNDDVAYIYDPEHQDSLLEVINVLLQKCPVKEIEYDLFRTLLFISSSTPHPDVIRQVQNSLLSLALKSDMNSTDDLYQKHINTLLRYLKQSAESWLEHTPQFKSFLGVLEFTGPSLGSELECLIDIFCLCISRKRDAIVSLKCFTKMQQLLIRNDNPLNSRAELGQYLPKFVSDCIAEFLPWYAGHTASSLRTSALSCLLAVCQQKGIEKDLIKDIKLCLNLAPTLIEDESEDTRLLSCELIYRITSNYPQLMDPDTVHRLADKLAKRLDDVKEIVRHKAIQVLSYIFENLPENYDSSLQSARLKDLLESMIIFLDDPDIKLQEMVVCALEKIGKLSPVTLREILERDCHKYRNKHYCSKIIDSMKALDISS